MTRAAIILALGSVGGGGGGGGGGGRGGGGRIEEGVGGRRGVGRGIKVERKVLPCDHFVEAIHYILSPWSRKVYTSTTLNKALPQVNINWRI